MVKIPGTRALHLAASHSDFEDARRLVGSGPGVEERSDWLLGMRGPGPALRLPPHMEWIRLPNEHEGSLHDTRARRRWIRDLNSLIETFAPDTVFLHRGFCRLWGVFIEDILRELPPTITVVGNGPGVDIAGTREAS